MNKKVVLITGGTSGLGKSTVELFARNNYDVIFTYSNNEEKAIKIAEDLKNNYNTNVLYTKCNLNNEEDINNLYNEIINKFNKIDVLINNAAICKDTLFEDKTKEDFMNILEVNLVGTFLLSKKIGKLMYENKNGVIINISSTNGLDTYYEYGLDYDASKAALINLNHNLSNHFAPYLRVNCVCPGWMNTNMNKDMDIEFKKKEENKILLNRFAEPNEVSELIYFLASDSASYINDSIIRIDGGVKHE